MVDLLKRRMPFAVAKISTSAQHPRRYRRIPIPINGFDHDLVHQRRACQWALDREIVLSRVISARRDVVFSAWADAKHCRLVRTGRFRDRDKGDRHPRSWAVALRHDSRPMAGAIPTASQFRRIGHRTLMKLITERMTLMIRAVPDDDHFRRAERRRDCDYPASVASTKAQRDAEIGFGAVDTVTRRSKSLRHHASHCVHKASAAGSLPAAPSNKAGSIVSST